MRRFFAFGCSFTNYAWSTWADILAPQYDFFENWGQSGAGNHYIFNSIMEADQRRKFQPGDTVIVCWTNVMREDRYITNRWITLGNIMTTPVYTKEFSTLQTCERGHLIRDLAYIKAAKILLEQTGVNWKFMSMCSLKHADPNNPKDMPFNDVFDLYETVLKCILPSYFEVLGDNFWMANPNRGTLFNGLPDYHPTPGEHLTYVDSVLPGWLTNDEIRVRIQQEDLNIQRLKPGWPENVQRL